MLFDGFQHVSKTPEVHDGLIASRSNAPAHIRAGSPLFAEMQKWFDQNATRRSVKPQSAIDAR